MSGSMRAPPIANKSARKMAQDPDWKIYLAENAKAGNIIEQNELPDGADRIFAADPDAEDP